MATDHTHPAARRRAVLVRVLVVLAVIAQLVACQAIVAADGPVPAVAQDGGHGVGHDPLCEATPAGASASSAPGLTCRANVPDPAPFPLVALLVAALFLTVRSASRAGRPSAPAQAPPGRRRLLAIDVIRV